VSRLRCLLVGRCCRIYLGYTGAHAARAFSAALTMDTPSASAMRSAPHSLREACDPPDRHGGLATLVDALRQRAAATSRPSSRRRQRRRRPRQIQARPEPHATGASPGRMRTLCSSPSSLPPSSASARPCAGPSGSTWASPGSAGDHRGHRTGGPRRWRRRAVRRLHGTRHEHAVDVRPSAVGGIVRATVRASFFCSPAGVWSLAGRSPGEPWRASP
jgi:hypothetical protein